CSRTTSSLEVSLDVW
nr:immunoglobulin heavy chain junction region [Macaca mulatta]